MQAMHSAFNRPQQARSGGNFLLRIQSWNYIFSILHVLAAFKFGHPGVSFTYCTIALFFSVLQLIPAVLSLC